MASEAAFRLLVEVVPALTGQPLSELDVENEDVAGATAVIANALDHHGAAMARLAAEYMADSMITPGRDGRVDAAVQHAKEAQDE